MATNEEEELLSRVGPGTPSGEVFRRYWLPVYLRWQQQCLGTNQYQYMAYLLRLKRRLRS